MNIGILTHPLINNYGGILQAYALSTVLKSMGHKVIFFDRRQNKSVKSRLLNFLVKCHVSPYYQIRKEIEIKTFKQQLFVHKYILKTPEIYSSNEMFHICKSHKLDALIVGSDQVWRADFELNYQFNYFFDFIPEKYPIKKFAYSASFGLDYWSYDKESTKTIKKLLNDFTSISVREISGKELCEKQLGYNAQIMIDPTLLLEKNSYENLMSPKLQDNYVLIYWLGSSNDLEEVKKRVDAKYNIVTISLRDDKRLPSVEDWLSYFYYANYIITNSFHGCVFSLIFNKDFYIDIKKIGAIDRIKSLFDLLDITPKLENDNYIIDYSLVNKKIAYFQNEAFNFLKDSLHKK